MFSGATFDAFSSPFPAAALLGEPCVRAGLLETLLTQGRDAMLIAEASAPGLAALRIVYANPACSALRLCDPAVGLTLGQASSVFRDALADPALPARVLPRLVAGLPVRGEALGGSALLDLSPLPCPDDAAPLWLITVRAAASDHTLLHTVINSLPDQIHVKDRQGRYLLDNEAHWQMRDLCPGGVAGKTVWDFFPPALAQLYEADDRTVLRTGRAIVGREEPTLDRDGARRWVSTTKTPLLGADGEIVGLVGISQDITDRKLAAEALRQSADDYRLLFQSNPQPMWVYEVETLLFLAVNAAAVARYGYGEAEFLGMKLPDIHFPEDLPTLAQELLQAPAGMRVFGPGRHLCRGGAEMWVETCSQPLVFNGRAGRIVVVSDVTSRRRAEAEAERLLSEAVAWADRDPLTGLLNHRSFHKKLEQESEAARQAGLPLAVAMMDLDNFRFFNDGYGHSVGDDLLRQVSAALSAACRPGDTLARYGGDEFALLLPGLGAEGAVRLADRLVLSLAGVGYRPPGYDALIPLTLSIGIAVFPDDGPGRLETLAAADARLGRVKTGGSGQGVLTDRLRANLPCSLADFSMLNALVTAVDAKDRYTRRHSEDVMAYSFQIAQELGLDEREQRRTLLAALLHDVGKIGVPDPILRKPGKLTEEEFEAIKQHPMMGSIIIGAVPGFEGALDAVRHHHERWDGKGYPFGLRGEETPLTARIMAVADAFSAMTTDRPYRKGMDEGQALRILQEGAGTQWDPSCVAAFAAARRALDSLNGWTEED